MTRLRYPEGRILSVAKVMEANAREQVAALAVFGITETLLNQFKANIQQAEALPGALALQSELRGQTVQKDRVLDEGIVWGQDLHLRLEHAFGKRSAELAAFPGEAFQKAKKSETQMMPLLALLITLAEKYEKELAVVGQTPAVLEKGRKLLEALRHADAVQETQKVHKTVTGEERRQLFLELYATVNKITQAAKLVFKNDPAQLLRFSNPWPARRKPAPGKPPATE